MQRLEEAFPPDDQGELVDFIDIPTTLFTFALNPVSIEVRTDAI